MSLHMIACVIVQVVKECSRKLSMHYSAHTYHELHPTQKKITLVMSHMREGCHAVL